MATDPVCGMFVDERSADLTLVRENRTYYFCSTVCLHQFAEPERELARLRARLAVAWPLTATVVGLTYVVHFPAASWVALALASVVQFYCGLPFYRGTWDAARARIWNMDVLIAIGTTAAYAYSAVSLVIPSIPSAEFFDASSLIIALILTGNYLEQLVRERAGGAVRRLREYLPAVATRITEGREKEIPLSEIRVGDVLRVRPGERIAADGTIREGRSTVLEALVTGESLPVRKGPGEPVLAGTVNGEGAVTIEVGRVGPDTFLEQIGRLVSEAEMSRLPLQSLADRIGSIFAPLVLLLAVVSAAAWFVWGGAGGTVALFVFVSVTITACPCAFGIATPAALLVGTGRGAEEGILFKGKSSMEMASHVGVVLADKTGTLTRGSPTLTDIVPAQGVSKSELLSLAVGLEGGSEHPLARAILESARNNPSPRSPVVEVRAEPGRGVTGLLGGHPLALLGVAAAKEAGVDLGPLASIADSLSRQGRTGSVVLRDHQPIGILGFSDEPSPGAAEAIATLRQDGIETVMVTGDNEPAARTVAEHVGIEEVHAGVSPEGKLQLIRELQSRGKTVAFVGDGLNDAPALTQANLGIAIGAGTDVAQEAGDVILVRSDLRDVPTALRLARATVRKVQGNLTWALGYNAVLLPVAMGGLVPLFGLGIYRFLPIAGALAMAVSSTLVVGNSYSLRWTRID